MRQGRTESNQVGATEIERGETSLGLVWTPFRSAALGPVLLCLFLFILEHPMDAELPSTSAEPEQVAPAPAVSPPPFQLPIPAGSSSNALLTTVEQTPQVSNHASSSGSTPPATPEPVTAPKKDKLKLVLVSPLPDENISHCHSCDRTFTPLLLRFKVCILSPWVYQAHNTQAVRRFPDLSVSHLLIPIGPFSGSHMMLMLLLY